MPDQQEPSINEYRYLSVLKDIAEALNETNDVSSAMAAILPRLSEILGLSTAWAFRYDPKRNSFVEVGASGLPPALAADNAKPLKCGWCECQDQFVEGRLQSAANIVRCSRLRKAEGDKQGLTYHASVPLRSKGKPLGILNVAAAGYSVFTQQALDLLSAVGHQVAVAVDRAGILADERHRANQLKAMSEMAAQLVSMVQPEQILRFAAERFVESLGYESCGIIRVAADGLTKTLIAAAHHIRHQQQEEYSYTDEDDNPLLDEQERLLQMDARSMMTCPIPQTEYAIRLESSLANAFHDADADILAAFSWHLTAALENAHLYKQSLQNAKWAERRNLAADLHDAVSQRLFSAQLLTETVRVMGSKHAVPQAWTDTLQRVQALISESQHEMKDLIATLRPVEDRNFFAQLQERIQPLQLQSSTRIHFLTEGVTDPQLTFDQREELLRVVDEALQNVFKHAKAANVRISLSCDSGHVQVCIEDDGIGFDETAVTLGLGTSTMSDRMHRIGGHLQIQSAPGTGTAVLCDLPVFRQTTD